MSKRKMSGLVGVIVMAMVLAGCGSSGTSGEEGASSGDKKLVVAVSNAPASLDPSKEIFHPMWGLAYEGILNLDAEGAPIAGLATEWGFVDDQNKVFSFTLREDAKFSDGTPVNAAAVKTWFEYMESGGGINLAYLGKIKSVATEGDYKVTLALVDSNPDVAKLLATGLTTWGNVASTTVIEENAKLLSTETFGAGPYVLDTAHTTTSDTYTFVPNEYYFDQDAIHWDEVVIRIIGNPSSRVQALQSGQVDAIAGNFSTLAAATAMDNVEVYQTRVTALAFVITDAMGETVPALGDVRVRQAMNYAIDRKTIAKAIYGDSGLPVAQIASSDAFFDEGNQAYEYDPERAKELLAEAGYGDGFSFDMVTMDFASPETGKVAQAVVAQWEAVGLKVNIKPSNSQTDYLKGLQGGAPVVQASTFFDRSMVQNYNLYLKPGGTFHPRSWVDADLADLYTQLAVAKDGETLALQMSGSITNKAYLVPVVASKGGWYVSSSIGNVEVTDGRTNPVLKDWTSAS